MEGRALVMQRGTAKAAAAAKVFEQVIAMDPAFAPAYAGLAEAYAAWSWDLDGGISAEDGIAAMRPAAEKALHLDPLLAEAHGAMGLTYAREQQWENARESFEEALRLSPSSTDLRASYAISTLVPLGELRKAQRLLAVARDLDPYSLAIQRDLGIAQYYGGRFENAVANLQAVFDRDPAFQFVANMLARTLIFAGRPADAIPLYVNRPGAKPKGFDRWLTPAYLKLGRQNDIDRLIEEHKDARPYQRAIVYAGLNDKDRTFEELNLAVDDSPQRTAAVLVYPEMAFLRGDPRFDDLKKRLNLR
jgi:serine/threonine-protein kinase